MVAKPRIKVKLVNGEYLVFNKNVTPHTLNKFYEHDKVNRELMSKLVGASLWV